MAFRNTIVRRAQDAAHRDTWRATLSEFISTLIFVFAASGSSLAVNRLTVDKPAASSSPPSPKPSPYPLPSPSAPKSPAAMSTNK
ncbi:probable aquaporin TIP-type [Cajanus cajan]|uniref:probable aquaporin TIP-type n=1 Tax=Cajanus cajan TaxID=3821 RepID=UPI0010FB5825|nr:probable aquaporin TIP-type [Cajanus cajan]